MTSWRRSRAGSSTRSRASTASSTTSPRSRPPPSNGSNPGRPSTAPASAGRSPHRRPRPRNAGERLLTRYGGERLAAPADLRLMRHFSRAFLGVLATLALAVWAGAGEASQPLYDANVQFLSLRVNGKGEALVTYRRADGRLRHVLVWGALDAREPSLEVGQVRFRYDYAGGWGKYRKSRYWKHFKNRCGAYDGPRLAMLVAACRAPDGTYWAVQAWQRRLPNLGFDPWLPQQSNLELHVSHWSGELPVLEVYPH